MTLNSEGLEKAQCEHDWFDCSNSVVQAPAKSCKKCGWTVGSDESAGVYIQWPGVPVPLPPVDGLEVVAWLIESERAGTIATTDLPLANYSKTQGCVVNPLVTLSQASSVIEGLKEANEALMRERTSLIATHRESIDRLTKERDDARKAFDGLSATTGKIVKERSSLEEENKRLSEAIDEIADFDDPDAALDPNVIHLIRIAGAARRSARQTLGAHNG